MYWTTASIGKLRRYLGYYKWKTKVWAQSRSVANLYKDYNKTYWIDPKSIVAALDFPGESSPLGDRGIVRAGNWDLDKIEWNDFAAYRAFQHRFGKNGKWSDTEWYQSLLEEIESGTRFVYGCHNREDLDAHFAETDSLFHRISTEGIRSASSLSVGTPVSLSREDDITVHIDRNGHYLFGDGRHRLFIAKCLGIGKIPVKVGRRHSQWVDFRREILNYVRGCDGRSYQPILHPDLEDIPFVHGHERFCTISRNLDAKNGSLLDIGANWGYFSQRFESIGFRCTAVESYPTEIHFLEKLKTANNMQFAIIKRSLLDMAIPLNHDVVLALNIFHHFLKKKELFDRWVKFLGKLETRELVLETHWEGESQMQNSYLNFSPQEFADCVSKNTGLRSIRCLGETSGKRMLYILSRG